MSVCHRPSSPVKKGFPPEETRSAVQTYKDLRDRNLLRDVVGESFLQAYLPGDSLNVEEWSNEEDQLVSLIQGTPRGQEPSLYTGHAPLLRLLNYVSKRVFEHKNAREALVFYCGDKVKVQNPFNQQHRTPDVIAVWETSQVFPTVDYSQNYSPQTTWCALATVGEAKVSKNGKHQLASYLRNYLELHPELNAALGFTAQSKGYALFYHDAEVIHQSTFSWKPGPLYAFVERLYTRPFKDTSMQILDPNSPDPVWATKIDGTVYVSEVPRVLPGPGQRRYTAVALDAHSSEAVFLKDVWRDEGRLFFEALLLEQAHSGQHLSGLMSVDSHGYVLDEAGRHLKTTSLGSVAGQSNRRHKMRMATRDIGRPLYEIRSLRQFLCVMYDACAVQRNLYRKCRILHRDISDGNIMLAPETSEYKQRCVGGFAEVKFVNQVLAKEKNPDPEPACLVIDLGNGSDLKVERGQIALTERTGTPKFIARSVSCGELLNEEDFENGGVNMPPMEGPLGEYSKFMHTIEYRDLNDPDSMVSSEDMQFAHQLFHDAESTFWVIAWTLARSAREAYQHETNPHMNYRRFYHTMVTHFPVPGDEDPRSNFKKAPTYWKSILHSDLEIMGPMLNKMFLYIRPEWAYRPDLNAEHVHEALMRLLLAEIVRIDETGRDVPLVIGARSIPPAPPGMQPLNQNSINSLSMDRSRSFPHHSLPVGQQTLSHNQSSPEAVSNTATMTIPIEPEIRAKLREQGKSLVWEREICKLEAPKYVTTDEET